MIDFNTQTAERNQKNQETIIKALFAQQEMCELRTWLSVTSAIMAQEAGTFYMSPSTVLGIANQRIRMLDGFERKSGSLSLDEWVELKFESFQAETPVLEGYKVITRAIGEESKRVILNLLAKPIADTEVCILLPNHIMHVRKDKQTYASLSDFRGNINRLLRSYSEVGAVIITKNPAEVMARLSASDKET